MTGPAPSNFNLRGRFAGFFRDVFRNRRMVLRVGGEEVFLEIPKVLQREIEGTLAIGQDVVVMGEDAAAEEGTGRRRRIVSRVQPARQVTAPAPCAIRICANKTCWRNGGQALWRTLDEKIATAGLKEAVTLKAVPCMDLCKQGPNVEAGGREYRHCSSIAADEILAPFIDSQAVTYENPCSTVVCTA